MAVTMKPEAQAAKPAPQKFVELELWLFQRYHRGGVLYEKEMAYRFTEEQAEVLLRECEDGTGRPIWRRYVPKPIQQVRDSGVKNVRDATQNKVADQADQEFAAPANRLDVGSEEEFREIVGAEASATI